MVPYRLGGIGGRHGGRSGAPDEWSEKRCWAAFVLASFERAELGEETDPRGPQDM